MRIGEQKLLSYGWPSLDAIMDGGFFEGALIMFVSPKPELEFLCALGYAHANMLKGNERVVHAIDTLTYLQGVPSKYLTANVDYRTYSQSRYVWTLEDTKQLIMDTEQGGKKVKMVLLTGLDMRAIYDDKRPSWYHDVLREHREYGRANGITFVVSANIHWSKAREDVRDMEVLERLDFMSGTGSYTAQPGCDRQADVVIYAGKTHTAREVYLRRSKNRGSDLPRSAQPNTVVFDMLALTDEMRIVK